MDRLIPLSFLAALTLSTNACTNNSVEIGGVPGWMINGAKIDFEPITLAPDPSLLDFKSESGPVKFSMLTDVRYYTPAPKKEREKAKKVEYERGRDYRVKQLFR